MPQVPSRWCRAAPPTSHGSWSWPRGTVSAHLSALAQSGLAVSAREGRLVLYSLTSSGRELLRSSIAPDLSGS